jgi:hypothetical protein
MANEEETVPETTHRTDNAAHGIENAFYSGGPGQPYFRPRMECMCGFVTERSCLSWEEAGQQLDAHLGSVGAA